MASKPNLFNQIGLNNYYADLGSLGAHRQTHTYLLYLIYFIEHLSKIVSCESFLFSQLNDFITSGHSTKGLTNECKFVSDYIYLSLILPSFGSDI